MPSKEPGQAFPVVPQNAPAEVRKRAEEAPRVPTFDPTLGVRVEPPRKGTPPHRTLGNAKLGTYLCSGNSWLYGH
jgi:hypothetical protein